VINNISKNIPELLEQNGWCTCLIIEKTKVNDLGESTYTLRIKARKNINESKIWINIWVREINGIQSMEIEIRTLLFFKTLIKIHSFSELREMIEFPDELLRRSQAKSKNSDGKNGFFAKIEKGIEAADKFTNEVSIKYIRPLVTITTIIAIIDLLLSKWDYFMGTSAVVLFGSIMMQNLDLRKEIMEMKKSFEEKLKNMSKNSS